MAERKEIYGWYPTTGVKPTVREVNYFDSSSEVTSPVDTTEVFQVRVRFSKEMDTRTDPTVWLSSSSGIDPTVPTEGTWSNVVVSGDSYMTPNIKLSGDHVGTITVGVSGGISDDGNTMSANNVADTFTLQTGAPTQRGFVINEGVEYINHPNVSIKWSATGAAQVWISGDVQSGEPNVNQWIDTNTSGDGAALGSGDIILASGSDGRKTVYAKFQTTSGDESAFVSDYIVLDRSGDAITDVACNNASGGAAIGNADWTTADEPYFNWSEPSSEAPIRGYAWVLTSGEGSDNELPSIINTRKNFVDFDGDPQTPGKYKFFVKAQDGAGNWGSGDQFDYWLASGDAFQMAGGIRMWLTDSKTWEVTDGEATSSGDGAPYMEWTDPQSPGDDTFYINTSGDDATENNYEFSTTNPNYTFLSTLGVGVHRIFVRPITGLGISGDLHEFTFIWSSGSLT